MEAEVTGPHATTRNSERVSPQGGVVKRLAAKMRIPIKPFAKPKNKKTPEVKESFSIKAVKQMDKNQKRKAEADDVDIASEKNKDFVKNAVSFYFYFYFIFKNLFYIFCLTIISAILEDPILSPLCCLHVLC
jgi:hypothetical protein